MPAILFLDIVPDDIVSNVVIQISQMLEAEYAATTQIPSQAT